MTPDTPTVRQLVDELGLTARTDRWGERFKQATNLDEVLKLAWSYLLASMGPRSGWGYGHQDGTSTYDLRRIHATRALIDATRISA